MSGLVISLKPNENFLVNGALLSNGSKRSQIRVHDKGVHVLRMSDALHPDEAVTPIKRVYYKVQLILSGDDIFEDMRQGILDDLDALMTVFEKTPMAAYLSRAKVALLNERFYSVLYALKSLFDIEAELLGKPQGNMNITEQQRIAG